MVTANLEKKNGVVKCDKSFDYLCSLLPNGDYELTITKKVKKRSLSQNALLWMWYGCIQDSTGTDRQDLHDYYCNKFLKHDVFVNGEIITVAGSTKNLNTKQFSEFMDSVQADAATELGINLPLPEDQYYQDFINEYKIKYL